MTLRSTTWVALALSLTTIGQARPQGLCGPVSTSSHPAGVAPAGDRPTEVAFTPDAARFVVAHRASKNLVVFDAATQAVLGTIALSGSPASVAVSADNVHAVTANLFEDTASIVDLNTFSEVAVVPVGEQPLVVRITPGGATAVVGNKKVPSVSVIDIATASEVHRIPTSDITTSYWWMQELGVQGYQGIGFACPTDDLAMHLDYEAETIALFDLTTGTRTSLPCAARPLHLAATPDGATVVVSHVGDTRKVTVFDVATQSISKVLDTGSDLWGAICIRPDGSQVAVQTGGSTRLIDVASGVVSPALNTGPASGYLPTPDGLHVLCLRDGAIFSWVSQSVVVAPQLQDLVSSGAHAPSGDRAVLLANMTDSNLQVWNSAGAAGHLEADIPSGPPPEANGTYRVAISPDGSRAVACNHLSDTVSVIDLVGNSLMAVVPVGNRPSAVAITPDGSRAVVTNFGSDFVSIVDLATFAVSEVPLALNGREIELSPDGAYAYISEFTGVWRVDLGTLSVAGQKIFTETLGASDVLSLSHDGATLAVSSFQNGRLTLIDTSLWQTITLVFTQFSSGLASATFSPDDQRIYASGANWDRLTVIEKVGGVWKNVGLIQVDDELLGSVVSLDGSTVFVASTGAQSIDVVDVGLGAMTAQVPLPGVPYSIALSPSGSCLYVASGTYTVQYSPHLEVSQSGALTVIDTQSLAVTQTIDLGVQGSELAFDASGAVGLIASPFSDELMRFDLPPNVFTYCTPSSTSIPGCQALLSSSGYPSASDPAAFSITAGAVPGGNHIGLAYFNDKGKAAIPFGSLGGFLCAIPGFRSPPKSNGGTLGVCDGVFTFTLQDLASTSTGIVVPGNTLNAGLWFRDPQNPDKFALSNGIEFALAP